MHLAHWWIKEHDYFLLIFQRNHNVFHPGLCCWSASIAGCNTKAIVSLYQTLFKTSIIFHFISVKYNQTLILTRALVTVIILGKWIIMLLRWWGNKLYVFKIDVWGFGMRVFPKGGEFLAVELFPEKVLMHHSFEISFTTQDFWFGLWTYFHFSWQRKCYVTDFCFVFWGVFSFCLFVGFLLLFLCFLYPRFLSVFLLGFSFLFLPFWT